MNNSSKLLAIGATLVLSVGCKGKGGESVTAKAEPAKVVDTAPASMHEPAPSAATGTEDVLARHLEAFGSANLDAILADYADDAVLVSSQGTIRGKQGLRELFSGLFAEFAKPGATFAMGEQRIHGELAYITWSAETADNIYELATDTFVVVDGKIAYQTFAGKIIPKNAPPPAAPTDAEPPPEGPTQAVLMHHLGAFGERNLPDLLSDYRDDSVLLGQMGEVVGADKLAPVFEGLFAEFAKPGASFEMRKMVVEGEVAFIEWSAKTADNVYEWATDTFVIRDGKIVYQTLAAQVHASGK